MTHDETMDFGARQYGDVLDALAQVGLDGEFIQTGGMCAALQVALDGGYHLLFTDQEEHAVLEPGRARVARTFQAVPDPPGHLPTCHAAA